MNSYIVAYDICHPKRLRKVARICEDFGLRKKLRARLHDVMKHDEDQVLFIPLCSKCAEGIESIGLPTEPVASRDVVIVT
jgi:CRISPR/Cas system-associated endoribonuclease Cas2